MPRVSPLLLVAAAVLAGVLGVLFGRATAPTPAAQPPKVTVDTLWMEQQRPQLERPSLGQKITTKAIKPAQVRVADAPSSAGREAVRRYCDTAPVVAPSRSSDSLNEKPSPPPAVPVAVLPDFGGRRVGPRLDLFSTLSDGRRWEWTGKARGRVTWQSCGDTACVRGDRWLTRIVRGTPKCAGFGAAGGAAGVLTGQSAKESVLTGLLTALGCAF